MERFHEDYGWEAEKTVLLTAEKGRDVGREKKKKGKKKKKPSTSTSGITSTTLLLWDSMFSVLTVLLINELCELTSWGPPISEKLLKAKKDNGCGRKCIMSVIICFPLEEQAWLSFGFWVVLTRLLP